ncbi:2OG-Fe(II) oxygenase [Actinomycetospora sp. OC33-EN08]|uniref:2OG-Fe(II) oxygenase n=1 Tax=Actinomycetospora aurantiaca TaxID=3129233 RepID=A0ABU8MUS0_9PSEU
MDLSALEALDDQGFATIPGLLDPATCGDLIAMFDDDGRFRSTISMARHAFGEGSYRYFADPLPEPVAGLRRDLYPPLAEVANRWAAVLDEPTVPDSHDEYRQRCAAAGQTKPTPLLLRYGPSGYNCLHQDVYGELVFPLQVLVMLSEPDVDFTGGESVFVEQRPRQQSRAAVGRPGRGDAIVFPVHHRPRRGARGYHRVQMRHGVSTVHSGSRHVLGIIFHDAR